MSSVPISIALVAGGLAVINPCGFPLLPAPTR
ncbi:MAG: cytochrome c biogenesis protein CcdA, partial [Actinobacteria bacterium]